ncbi:MAG: MFS transporter [Myxococcota bacterium]
MSIGAVREKPPPLFKRNFSTLLVAQASFGYAFSSFFMLPKFLVTELAAGPGDVGLVAAAYSTATIICIPAMGVLVDHFGRSRFMTAGALLMATLCLAFTRVADLGPLIFALRAGQGVAFAMVFVGGATIAVDEAPAERVGQAIALFGLAMLAMNGVAAAGVEAIASSAGWPWAFVAAAAASSVCAVLSLSLRDRAVDAAPAKPRSLWQVIQRPELVRLMVVIGMVGAAMSTVVTFHQPFAISLGIDTVSGFFVAYAAAAMIVRAGLGHYIDRAGRARVAIASLCLYAVDVAAMAWMSGPAGLVVLGVGLGAAHGFAYPSLNSLAIGGVRANERGKVMAVFQGAFHVGFAGAAMGFGVLAEHSGYVPVFYGGGICALVGVLVMVTARARGATDVLGGDGVAESS